MPKRKMSKKVSKQGRYGQISTDKIINLYKRLRSMRMVAEQLKISVNAVSRRLKKAGFVLERNCLHCGTKVTGAQKAYCSSGCREAATSLRKPVHHTPKPCARCGKDFTPKRSDQIYCSHQCSHNSARASYLERNKKKVNRNDLIQAYEKHSLQWIQENLGIDRHAAAKILNEAGIVTREKLVSPKRIIHAFDNDRSIRWIQKNLHTSKMRTRKILVQAGRNPLLHSTGPGKITNWKEVKDLYVVQRLSCRAIADLLNARGITARPTAIRNGLIKRGVAMRSNVNVLKNYIADRSHKANDYDRLRAIVEEREAALARAKDALAEAEKHIPGPKTEDAIPQRAYELYDQGLKWAAVHKKIEEESKVHTTLKALQERVARWRKRMKEAAKRMKEAA
jgi:hypothetical protein